MIDVISHLSFFLVSQTKPLNNFLFQWDFQPPFNPHFYFHLVKLSNKERAVDDSMTVFNKLLAQVQDSAPKSQVMMNNAPTEQDILANLLGKKMKIEPHSQPQFQSKDFDLIIWIAILFCLVSTSAIAV